MLSEFRIRRYLPLFDRVPPTLGIPRYRERFPPSCRPASAGKMCIRDRLLSALTGIKEKLDAVHIDVLAVKKQHNMIMGDPILDFYETCQMLHLSERQVRRLREEKKLIGFTFGSKRMYRYSEVKRYIDKMERKSQEQLSEQYAEHTQNK